MIYSFRNLDKKWISYRGSGWRPTHSPCLLGSCRAPGSCPGTGHAGPASPVSSLVPGRSPQYTGPSRCCWDLRTSHTQAAPSTGNMSASQNSSGLENTGKKWGKKPEILYSLFVIFLCFVLLSYSLSFHYWKLSLHFKLKWRDHFKTHIFLFTCQVLYLDCFAVSFRALEMPATRCWHSIQ